MSMEWFRHYHGAIFDPKWTLVAAEAETSVGNVAVLWMALLEYASQQDHRGSIVGFNCKLIDHYFGMERGVACRILEALKDPSLGIIHDDELLNWDKRQPISQEGSAERTRQWRERKRAGVTDGDVTVTSQNVTVTDVTDGDVTTCHRDAKIREEKIREEKKKEDTPPSPPMGGAGHLDASPLPEAQPSGHALQPQEPAPPPRKSDQLRQLATMVIAAYHEQLPELHPVRSVEPVRKAIAARIRDQDITADERAQRQGLDWWRNLFAAIRGMPWLMGQATSRDGRVFACSLPWILGPQNLAKILNGAYVPRDGPKSTGSSLTDRNMATLAEWVAEKEGAVQ